MPLQEPAHCGAVQRIVQRQAGADQHVLDAGSHVGADAALCLRGTLLGCEVFLGLRHLGINPRRCCGSLRGWRRAIWRSHLVLRLGQLRIYPWRLARG